MEPTPGLPLDQLNQALLEPTRTIVARLAKNPIVNSPDKLLLADIVECDFPGYTPFTYKPNLEGAQDTEFYGEMAPYRIDFVVGDIVAPQQVVAVYVTEHIEGQDPTLVDVALFNPPLQVYEKDQVLSFDGTLALLDIADD